LVRNLVDTVAFSPPLVISEAEIDALLDRVGKALDETAAWVAQEGLASVA
jgi:4-aminobutyrate--pyruvate transaminase